MTIEKADRGNIRIDSMDRFDRYQEVRNVYRLREGELCLVPGPFTEDWDLPRRRAEAEALLSAENVSFCALEEGRVLGAIILIGELNDGRMIADSVHVSREQRRRGIGRMLIRAAKEEAKRRGARALYFSACSAEETIRFYLAMGCRLSPDPIRAYAEKEPWDIQLELPLEGDTLFHPLRVGELGLKNIGPEDAGFIVKQFSDERVNEYLFDAEPITTLAEAEELIAFYCVPEPRDRHRWIIVSGEEKIGTLGFHRWDREKGTAEIGWDLQPSYQRSGIMSRRAAQILRFGREEMGLKRVAAHIAEGNTASVRLARKLGFSDTGRTYTEQFRGKGYLHHVYETEFR